MPELTQDMIAKWLELEDDEFHIDRFREKHGVSPTNPVFYKSMQRFVEQKKLKRTARGVYRKIKTVKPIKRFTNDIKKFDLLFPKSVRYDDSEFGFETIPLYAGDLLIISGVSNYGKTTLAVNILARNLDRYKCILMGNEYVNLDNTLNPKFENRLKEMDWVEWTNGDGEFKFDLLPVKSDFEDYVVPGALNLIDWINLEGDRLYMIGKVIEDIKSVIGDGLAVVVLQKEETKDLGRGGGFTRDLADLYMKLDPLGKDEVRLTLGKVKTASRMQGRMWGFSIEDNGANLRDIREIESCQKCHTKGSYYDKNTGGYAQCTICQGKGYVDKL